MKQKRIFADFKIFKTKIFCYNRKATKIQIKVVKIRDILTKINFIISTLEKNEHHAFLVGGCVRDLLLGIPPSDFDIASSAQADEILSLIHI